MTLTNSMTPETTILYRPVGPKELALLETGMPNWLSIREMTVTGVTVGTAAEETGSDNY